MTFFNNHSLVVYRNRRKGTSNRYGMSATFTSYQGDIQPASPTQQQMFPDRWGAVFTAFVDVADNIQEGDQIRTEDGKVYSVKGVQKWDGGGAFSTLDHLELVLVAVDAS